MKTTFYKRIIPLAMIASLAMSGASVYAEAIPQTADEVEILIDSAEAPAAVLDDVIEYQADDSTSATDPSDAPSEAPTEAPTEAVAKKPVIAAATTDAITVGPFDVFDVDESTTTATLKFTYTKSQLEKLDPTKVEITNKSKKAIAGVTIAKKDNGEENDVTVDYDAEAGTGNVTVKVEIAKKVKATDLYLYYDKASAKVISTTGAKYTPADPSTYTYHRTSTAGGLSYSGLGEVLDYSTEKAVAAISSTSIKESGFANNENLKKVIFGSSTKVDSIGAKAFENCKNLQKIETPATGIITIGEDAFKGCESLSVLDFSKSTAQFSISANAFTGLTQNIVILHGASNNGLTWNGQPPKNVTIIQVGDAATKPTGYSVTASAADEDVIQIEPNSGLVLQGTSVIGKLDYGTTEGTPNQKPNVDLESITWSITGGTAKFAKVKKDGKLDLKAATEEGGIATKQFTAASVTGTESIYLSNAKSGGKINKTITVKGTYKDGNTKKDYASFTLYVNPAPVSEFKDVKEADNSSKFTFKVAKKAAPEAQAAAEGTTPFAEYTLTMWEGAAYSPAVAAKNGDDKTIIYEVKDGSGVVKVVNGKITAIGAGSATVIAKPLNQANDNAYVQFDVTVNPYLKKIRANTTNLTMVPGAAAQEVTISAANSTGADSVEYTVSAPDTVSIAGLNGGKISATNGVLNLKVSVADGKTVNKTDKIEVSTADGGKVTIKLTPKTAPENAKKFTEKVKLDKVTNTRIVNVPVGGTANLNLAVSPATADSGFTWTINDNESGFVDIVGDVVVAKKVGTVTAYATSTGLASNCDPIESSVYTINVYDPATPINLAYSDATKNDEKVVVKGGFLMTSLDADTATSKKVTGGKEYTIDLPTLDEEVVWTVNNPAGAFVDAKEGKLHITVLAKGTYTITGTSAITKQKYSFKVGADALTENNPTAVKLYTKTSGSADSYTEVSASEQDTVKLNVGDKLQLALNATDACYDNVKNISFASSDSKLVAVTPKGLLTVKKATPEAGVTITAKIGSEEKKFVVKAEAAAANVKLTVPSYAKTGASIKLTAKGMTPTAWFAVPAASATDSTTAKKLAADGTKFVLGTSKDALLEAGDYVLVPATKDTIDDAYLASAPTAPISIFDTVATKVVAVDPWKVYVDGTAKEDGNLGTLKDLSNAKIGVAGGTEFVLPLNVTGVDADTKKTIQVDPGQITWESSNVSLATVDTTAINSANAGDRFVEYKVKVNKLGYTGKVTLTGTIKNSGKKVKVTLNVKEAPKAAE